MAFTGDLGRVQGGSFFHTMAVSSTSVPISSLRPSSLTPFAGDAVAFSNGDIRQITAVNGNTVALGEVLWSNKGDPGIGNATLSNIDGDSTVNGFTQEATKGIAQAKNHYNLGYYDTYVPNSDGTGTVTRKAKYFKVTNTTPLTRFSVENGARTVFVVNNVGGIGRLNAVSNSSFEFRTDGLTWNIPGSATVGNIENSTAPRVDFCVSGDVTEEEFRNQYLTEPIYIQYESPTEYVEKVIKNQPIHTLPQAGEDWLREEWGKQKVNGSLVHENRVPLYMTTDSASPAQTIGGDWGSVGSFTSGSNTIYVWRKLQ